MTTSDPSTNQTLPWPVSNALRQYREQSRNLKKVACRNVAQVILQRLYRAAVPESSRYREMLLLEATQKGLVPLAMELLQGQKRQEDDSPIDTVVDAVDLPPVSFFIKDKKDNSLLHLAVLSGKPKMVSALQKFLRDMTNYSKYDKLRMSVNTDLETPFSLSIRNGNMQIIFAFLKKTPYCMNTIENLEQSMKSLRLDPVFTEEIERGDCTLKEVQRRILPKLKKDHHDAYDPASRLFSALAMLDARQTANDVVKDALDRVGRRNQLLRLEVMPRHNVQICKEQLDVKSLRQQFCGVIHPWWDKAWSNFNRESYISQRPYDDNQAFFGILQNAIACGNVVSALYLLKEWKAPVSLIDYAPNLDYENGGEWYSRLSGIVEMAVTGWTEYKAVETLRANECKDDIYDISHVLDRVMGRTKIYRTKTYRPSIDDFLPRLKTWDCPELVIQDLWNELYSLVSDERKGGRLTKDDSWFDISPLSFAAIKIACSSNAEAFEGSDHAYILRYFFETVYPSNVNYTPADLPCLANFIALDHLPFLQFLTKKRNNDISYLSLDTPLLCPTSQPMDESDNENDEEDLDSQCIICYECCDDPFPLSCGHRFHHRCFFGSVFNEESITRPGENATCHEFLSRTQHLSFTISNNQCPYCQQYSKPHLPCALALNLADGIRRTVEEKINRPLAPHLDIEKCQPGVTVGEALLAFSACCGAIGIFQHLVVDCGIEPDQVHVGGVNVMHHAVAHNQILIIRWLLKKGYSSLLYGRMSQEAFDSFMPSSGPDAMMEDLAVDLGDANVSERLSFWKKEFARSRLGGSLPADYEYSEKELDFVQGGLSTQEVTFLRLLDQIEMQSPLHYLMVSSSVGRHIQDWLHSQLRSMNLPFAPANWYGLVLKFSLESKKRSDALCYLSHKVLSVPGEYRRQQMVFPSSRTKVASLYDVLQELPKTEALSSLSIVENVDSFNFWKMLGSGDEWIQFFRLAKALNVWDVVPYYDFVPGTSEMRDDLHAFVKSVINQGRVDILVAFCSMDSFCGKYSSAAYLLDNAERPYGRQIPLRAMIKQSPHSDEFTEFLAHIDKVTEALGGFLVSEGSLAYSFERKILSLLDRGGVVEEIRLEAARTRGIWLQLAGNGPPLGLGTKEEIERSTDFKSIDWTEGSWYCGDRGRQSILDLIVQKKNRKLMDFMIAHAFQRSVNIGDGVADYPTFIVKERKNLANCCDPIFAVSEFVRFGAQQQECDRAIVMRQLLLQRHDLGGGFLGDCFFWIIINGLQIQKSEEAEESKRIQRNEKLHELVQWFLDQPEILSALSIPAINANTAAGTLLSAPGYSFNYPHEIYRMLDTMRSKGLSLDGNDFEQQNLVGLLFKWEKDSYGPELALSSRLLGFLRSRDEYKDASGSVVSTISQVVEWLALDVGVNIQHLSYNDLTSGEFSRDRPCRIMTEADFESLKARQLSKMTRNDFEQYHSRIDDDMEVDDFHSCASDTR